MGWHLAQHPVGGSNVTSAFTSKTKLGARTCKVLSLDRLMFMSSRSSKLIMARNDEKISLGETVEKIVWTILKFNKENHVKILDNAINSY